MTHCTDDDLILHYYGEPVAAEEHLAGCEACRERYMALAATLASIRLDVPETSESYGEDTWRRIEPRLVRRASVTPVLRWALAAAAMLALMTSVYLLGRYSAPSPVPSKPAIAVASDDAVQKRVLLLTIADHLERSDRVLTEIMHAPDAVDLAQEQQWASDLVAANRLYRQDAVEANETSIAAVLDELERALLDIVHRPAHSSAADLERIRARIDAAALLFKVRVMTSDLRDRELHDNPAPQRRTSPVS